MTFKNDFIFAKDDLSLSPTMVAGIDTRIAEVAFSIVEHSVAKAGEFRTASKNPGDA